MTPKLRFPEFTDEWQVKKLGDIAEFSKGAGVSKSDIDETGDIEAIRYGELYTIYSEVIAQTVSKIKTQPNLVFSKSNDIIIPASGEDAIDIATASVVTKSGVALGGDLNIIRLDEDGIFIAYCLNNAKKKDIAKLAQGVSVIHLYTSGLKTLHLTLPSKPEQEKIADFLTAVDERIRLQEQKLVKLEQYKRGVMQQIFSQKIRFKDENGNEYPDWEEKKLGDIALIKTGKKDVNQGNPKGQYPFFTCAREHTYSDEYSFEGEAIMIAGNGEVGLCTYYNGKFEAYQRTYVLQDFKIPAKYLFIYLEEAFQTFAESQKQQGSMPYIKLSTLQNFKVPMQSEEEQQKIASFLTVLDDKIKLEEAKLTGAKEFKKALLQRMFV